MFNELKEVYFAKCNVSEVMELIITFRCRLLSSEPNLSLSSIKSLFYFNFSQFTFEGIQALVTNCTSIEVLDLSDCKSIDDECVKIIATSLPRLTTIKLNNCDKLTSKICHFFYENCRDLRVNIC
jgi:hypothetical protein